MPQITFLDLPGEIRNQIYILLLVFPSLRISSSIDKSCRLHPAILQSCHQIYLEAREVLYGGNTFIAHPSLLCALPRLRFGYGPVTARPLINLIQRWVINIRLDCDPNFNSEEAKTAFDGAEELTVQVYQAQYGSSSHEVLKPFEAVRGVKRAKIVGSITTFPQYVNWLQDTIMSADGTVVPAFESAELHTMHGGR
ncbi:hypothetical protein F5884DRAFT_518098 [Xylogone sp. PMI_703]|nr:hypothetical protein F5884DRAFT_518098 [Xylogone sp. PMI_703]